MDSFSVAIVNSRDKNTLKMAGESTNNGRGKILGLLGADERSDARDLGRQLGPLNKLVDGVPAVLGSHGEELVVIAEVQLPFSTLAARASPEMCCDPGTS